MRLLQGPAAGPSRVVGPPLLADMGIAPGAGMDEAALPDAEPGLAGGGFLMSIIIGGERPSRGNQRLAQILGFDCAMGKQAAILVPIPGVAINRAAPENRCQLVAGATSARPVLALLVLAGLRQFGRIDAKEAHSVLPQDEAVSVADSGATADRRWRAVERGREHCGKGKNNNGEHCAALSCEQAISMRTPPQDFTAH